MASFCFDFISILMLSTAWAAQNFVPVSVCPRDLYSWNLESGKKNCQGDTPNYLCAAIENQVGNFGEICTKFGLTPANKCAVLNEQTHNLDSVDCKADSGCPAQPYIPSVLWQYQICYKDFYGTTTSPAPITTPNITSTAASSGNETVWDGSEDGGSGSAAGVAVAVILIILIIVAVVVMVVFYVRNQFGFRDKVQQLYTDFRKYFQHGDENSADAENVEAPSPQKPLPEQGKETDTSKTGETKEELGHKEKNAKHEKTKTKKEKVTNTSKTSDTKEDGHQGKHVEPEKKIEKLKELLKYLVYILKQELRVIDLKEKVVIHSKSINEHFTEPLIKDLQSLNDINDYSRLDTSLVLTLLRNFCEGIKPSSKGWDYEPPEDETHVGADIERIRLMWNKYCDDDFEFKHLDEVYNRMKQKYGTVAVHGDDDNRKPPHKEKEKTKVVLGGDGIGKPPHEEGNKVVLGLDGNRKPPHKEEENTEVVPGLDGNRKPPLKDKENTEVVLGGDGNRKPPHKEEESTEVVPGLDGNRKPPLKDKENTEVVHGGDGNRKPPHKDEENTEVVPGSDGNRKPPLKDKENAEVVHGGDCNRKPPHKEQENSEVVPGLDGNRKPPHKEENKEVVFGLDGNRKPPLKDKENTEVVLGLDGNRKQPHKDEENTEVVLGGYGNMKPLHKDDENSKGLECMKIKIPSIKLNEDCTVEKGIVITENITTALKILKSRNVVILKGVIGCGKTHALKAIKNNFQERNWRMSWLESENFEGEFSLEKPTIFLCDNLFGKFGASVFSQDAVNKTEKALKEIESSKQETKVVIGIHTHVYDEVKKNLKLNFLHQKNITVEMDKLSDAEALLIFKEQLKKGHCEMDDDCWFKTVGFQSVLDKLSKNQGHIGGPFLSLMYCNQHELFSDEAFSVNPVQTLMQHLKRMQQDSPRLYDCLVYLMCVQQHNIEEEPEIWVGHISVEITKDNLKYLAKTSRLLQVDTKIATLAHELLTTVIFKSAAETEEIFLPVLQMCESEVFLQLLRPTTSSHSDLYFEYTDDLNPNLRDVGRLCTYRLARMYKKQKINHPFKTVELFKEKYEKYSIHKPKKLSLIRVSYE